MNSVQISFRENTLNSNKYNQSKQKKNIIAPSVAGLGLGTLAGFGTLRYKEIGKDFEKQCAKAKQAYIENLKDVDIDVIESIHDTQEDFKNTLKYYYRCIINDTSDDKELNKLIEKDINDIYSGKLDVRERFNSEMLNAFNKNVEDYKKLYTEKYDEKLKALENNKKLMKNKFFKHLGIGSAIGVACAVLTLITASLITKNVNKKDNNENSIDKQS